MLIRVKALKNFGDKKPVALPYELHVDLLAADDHHIVRRVVRADTRQFVQIPRDETALLREIFLRGQNNIRAVGQRIAARQAFERRAPHDNDLAACFLLKIFEIPGQMCQEVPVLADAPVQIGCSD